jgi:hypothetical protein
MADRSFIKEKDLKNKFMKYTRAIGDEFGNNKSVLSDLGNRIINKFVKDNNKKEEIMLNQESELEKIRKSKPKPIMNPWKFSNHLIGEFSICPVDKIHSFEKEKKVKNLVEEPFRIPSKYGNYFEKDFKIL